jgi:hypothetical protein
VGLLRVRPGSAPRVSLTNTNLSRPRHADRPRVAGALICALALLLAGYGLAWDIRWHVWVGRDTFWTPPHLVLYAGVIVAGSVCIARTWVAIERGRKPVPGYTVGSLGALGLVIAAPFDDLWHRLYGIDVDLWTPAHLLGLLSGSMLGFGLAWVWAGLSTAERADGRWGARTWMFLFVLAGLLTHFLTLSLPALNKYPTLELGPVHVLTLPILQTAALSGVLVGAARRVRHVGAAATVIALVWARQAIESLITPPLMQASMVATGANYRLPGGMPNLGAGTLLAPMVLIPAAILVEIALWAPGPGSRAARAGLAGVLVGLAQLATAPISIRLENLAIAQLTRVAPDVVGAPGAGVQVLSTLPAAAPVALGIGLLVALTVDRYVARVPTGA